MRLIAAGFGVLVATGAMAQSAPTGSAPAPAPATAASEAGVGDRRAATRAELDQIQRDIEIGRTRQAELRRDIDGLERDRTRIAEQVVRTAARIQASEARVGASEVRIQGLDDDLARLRGALAGRRGVLADVLAALQRIGRKPPPAVVVRPEDALAAVRSAILIGALLPELRVQAERLLADLATLEEVKQAAAAERDRFRAEATDLATERIRLELLLEERRQSRGDQERRLDEERRRGQELAERANGLRDLIARLEAETPRPTPPAEGRPGGLGDAGRLQPAVAFAEARGTMSLPVTGRFVRRFGEDDGLGGTAKGVTLATRERAQVTSPCDGWVVFLGPFRSYGKLLIINGGGGYHVVLAGLDRIDVEPGRFVLAGEPVGVMGSGSSAAVAVAAPGTVPKDEAAGRPALYVEFRKDNASIDPTPWWTQTRDEKVRG